jgi:hypothetical protein
VRQAVDDAIERAAERFPDHSAITLMIPGSKRRR